MKTIEIKTVGKLLTARPKGMSYEEYKKARKQQEEHLRGDSKRNIRGRLKGILIPSSQYRNSQDPRIVIV